MQAILVRLGLVSLDQLADALRENVETGRTVEDIAVSRGWVDPGLVAKLRAVRGETAPEPPAPAPAPAPPFETPAAQHEIAPTLPTPVPAPAPPSAATPAPARNGEASVGVFINLEGGQRLWVGRFPSEDDGQRRAQELIDSMMRPEPGVWPRFGNRFVRPSAVVGVEISKRRDD